MRAALDTGALLRSVLAAAVEAVDADALLERVAHLLVGGLADAVVVDRLADPDLVVRIAALGPEGPLAPSPPGPDASPLRPRRSSAVAGGLLPRLLLAPSQLLHLDDAALTTLAAEPDPLVRAQVGLARRVGATSVLLLALGRPERPAGVLTLLVTHGSLTDGDVDRARDVARVVGLALDALRLQEVQRDLSQAMQTSLLPPLPPVPGLSLAARYHPAVRGLQVGGDWYDAFAVGADGSLDLVIGDAAGHDTRAAARMAELRHALRTLAVDRPAGPAEVLQRLDRALRALSTDAGATCLHARLGAPDGKGSRRMTWSSAGHLPPVLLSAGRAVLLDRPPDLMLGVDADSPRSESAVDLEPGDLVLLCTDGLVEDRRVDLDERLELLRATVELAHEAGTEELADLLVAQLAPRSEDDVALLAVRVLPPDLTARRPLQQALQQAAPARAAQVGLAGAPAAVGAHQHRRRRGPAVALRLGRAHHGGDQRRPVEQGERGPGGGRRGQVQALAPV